MIIHDVKQGSPEWLKLRLGVVTASEIDALVTPEGKVRIGAGPQTYLYRKLAERLLGLPANQDFASFAMNQGAIVEGEAIPWYSFAHSAQVDRVGFCTSPDGKIGFSPDGLIGDEGGVEVKSPQPATHLQYLLEGVVPKDYVMQMQFSLYVSGRKWWKFISYSRQLPPLVLHVEPDARLFLSITAALDEYLPRFEEKLAHVVKLKAQHQDPREAAYEAKIKRWEETGEIP